MTKPAIILFWVLIFTASSFAQTIISEQAAKVARNVFYEKLSGSENQIPDIEEVVAFPSEKNVCLYIVNFVQKQGFVLVSADDRVYPVLAYSNESDFQTKNLPPNVNWWINGYVSQIEAVKRENIPSTPETHQAWAHYLSNDFVPQPLTLLLNPILPTKWDQGCYYNDSCPAATGGPCNRVYVGCVAVAMAQIMKYHGYPTTGQNSHSYYHVSYGTQKANFGATTYNYSSMPNTVSAANPEVARLLYHCGVSVEMNYGTSGSGASSADARTAFINYFKYSNSTISDYRDGYADTTWAKLLRIDLNQGRPIYYSGRSTASGGHAFVCDGFQGTANFHFNWGWSGGYNGYFNINNLKPGGNDFTQDQMIILVRPTSLGTFCSGTKTLTAPSDTFSDGSGIYFYTHGNNCRYLIQPTGATNISLHFKKFSTEPTYDYVQVYNGANTSAPLIGKFSGSSIPPVITSSGGSLYLRFITDQAVADEGWSAYYAMNSTALNENSNNPPSGFILPNPASDEFSLAFQHPFTGKFQLTLSDISGKTVFSTSFIKELPAFSENIPVQMLGKGVYLVHLFCNEFSVTEKLIITR